jgi:hypothetical protein
MTMAGLGPKSNREEEKKMNKQMTPAEIELLQQSRLAPISAKAALVGVESGPMSHAEHSRRSRARQRDDEIVRFRFGTLAAPSMAPCEMVSMSALGQKRTCATHKLMSALPPKATSNAT